MKQENALRLCGAMHRKHSIPSHVKIYGHRLLCMLTCSYFFPVQTKTEGRPCCSKENLITSIAYKPCTAYECCLLCMLTSINLLPMQTRLEREEALRLNAALLQEHEELQQLMTQESSRHHNAEVLLPLCKYFLTICMTI